MKEQINKKIREIVMSGNYIASNFCEDTAELQGRMSESDYNYDITTSTNTFNFTTRDKTFKILVSDFDWRIFWDKLGDIPTNDDGEIESEFEHFDVGAETSEIWQWFEWFFDISLGEAIF
jgi:hypothetical protein